ncbi:hypothetical protein [Mycetocola saprophilus]|uniref:hypothetical protein n=1 Tax=Mycetocola saprophilus TaxID=76636 RepID=UPI0004BFF073|nr:hypothetical protein [Mycetocola saprophilus]
MRVVAPDLELWLTKHVRALAAAENKIADVSNKEPSTLAVPLKKPLIVIRVDPGARLSPVTFDISIGASVLAGSKQNESPAKDLARWLAGILHDDALPLVDDSPIAFVNWDGCTSPATVIDQLDVSRQYLTAQYVVSGSW